MPKRIEQRQALDVNEIAHLLVERSTVQPPEPEQSQPKKRRKRKPPAGVSEYMSKIGKKGGVMSGKRRMNMDPNERSRIAAAAARARWKRVKEERES